MFLGKSVIQLLQKPLYGWLIVSSFFVTGIAFAISSSYSPGETLDPACAPGEENCTVSTSTISFEGVLTSLISRGAAFLSDELLTDEGFEDWDVTPAAWYKLTMGEPPELSDPFERSITSHSGNFAAFYNHENALVGYAQDVNLAADSDYVLKLWAKGDAAGLGIVFADQAGDNCYQFTGDFAGSFAPCGIEGVSSDSMYVFDNMTDSWVEYTVPTVPITGTAEYAIAIMSDSLSDFYVDDISLQLDGAGDNLLTNGDFETWEGNEVIPLSWVKSSNSSFSSPLYLVQAEGTAGADDLAVEMAYEDLGDFESNNVSITQSFVGLTPDDLYTLSLYAKAEIESSSVYVSYSYDEELEGGDTQTYYYNFTGDFMGTWVAGDWPSSDETGIIGPISTWYGPYMGASVPVPASGAFTVNIRPGISTITIDDVELQNGFENLIQNGSFDSWVPETSLNHWGNGGFDPDDGYISEESTLVHSGNFSVKVTSSTAGDPQLVAQVVSGLTPGNDFEFTYYALAGTASNTGLFLFDGDDDNDLGYNFSGPAEGTWTAQGDSMDTVISAETITGSWAEYTSGTIPVPDSGEVLIVVFGYEVGVPASTVYLDDFSFKEFVHDPVDYFTFDTQEDSSNISASDRLFSFKSVDDYEYFAQKGDSSFVTDADTFDFSTKPVVVGNAVEPEQATNGYGAITLVATSAVLDLSVLVEDTTVLLYTVPTNKVFILSHVDFIEGDVPVDGVAGYSIGSDSPAYNNFVSFNTLDSSVLEAGGTRIGGGWTDLSLVKMSAGDELKFTIGSGASGEIKALVWGYFID